MDKNIVPASLNVERQYGIPMEAILTALARLSWRIASLRLRNRIERWVPPWVKHFNLRLPNGQSLLLPGIGQATVITRMYWKGFEGNEPVFSKKYLGLVEHSRTIVDLGSYIGYYAMIAAKVNPCAKIFSVEPVPESVEYQKTTTALNGLENVVICPLALSDESGTKTFYLPTYSQSRIPNIGALDNRFGEGMEYPDRKAKEIEVETLTLEELSHCYHTGSIDLIKFYIEGSEARVLLSGKDLIARDKPDLIGWIFIKTDRLQELDEMLNSNGYLIYVLNGDDWVSCERLSDAFIFGELESAHRRGRVSLYCTTRHGSLGRGLLKNRIGSCAE